MCGVCGCSEGETRIESIHARRHEHGDESHHNHNHNHSHSVEEAPVDEHEQCPCCDDVSVSTPVLRDDSESNSWLVKVEQDLLSKNDALAAHNRIHFAEAGVLALNLVSSPGAGKTTLLVNTLEEMLPDTDCAVIEGDQETTADADRIRETGAPALQVNTGKGCHLDADMVHKAFHHFDLRDGILFIENVGNLVCPAGFDLGEAHKVVIASVTEGEDKPLKYPNMFAAASLMLVSKVDLLPYLDFDVDALINNARKVNPGIAVICISVSTGEGMDRWRQWLKAAQSMAAVVR